MNKIRGEVTYILRDKSTESIISTATQQNIVTDMLYRSIANYFTAYFRIGITSVKMVKTPFCLSEQDAIKRNRNLADWPVSSIPSVGRYITFNPGEYQISDPYIEYNGRFNPLSTTRTINSIYLHSRNIIQNAGTNSPSVYQEGNNIGFDTYDSTTTYAFNVGGERPRTIVAFLPIDSPVEQTTSQILDIYYRLYFSYDYTNTDNVVSFSQHQQFVYDLVNVINRQFTTSGSTGSGSSPFKIPKLKGQDINRFSPISLGIPARSLYLGDIRAFPDHIYNPNVQTGTASAWDLDTAFYSQQTNFTNSSFNQHAGKLIGAVTSWKYQNGASLPSGGSIPYMSFLTNIINFDSTTNKISNIFGLGNLSSNPLDPNFVNVDNLSPNPGKVYIEGTWNNKGTPSSPGLYYTASLPEMVFLKLTNPGNVGTSTYKILKQKYFGYLSQAFPKIHPNDNNNYSNYLETPQDIFALSARQSSRDGITNVVYDKTFIEDIGPEYLSPRQISASCRYDDSSIVFVKSNKIILYNIAAADYWKYEAGYTAIHQVAVVSNKIYVACRATGLWVIDPYNSNTVTSLSTPEAGIDLSVCHGVAEGYNNSVWAVGANGLFHFNGTAWTKYDETTTPAITMAGVTDNNWFNIEYIKVDKNSINNNMLLVRKASATVNSNLLGVWWSTLGTTTNTGAEFWGSLSTTYAFAPRINRGHIDVLHDFWVMYNYAYAYKLTFGTSSITQLNQINTGNFNPGEMYNSRSPAPSVMLLDVGNSTPVLWIPERRSTPSGYTINYQNADSFTGATSGSSIVGHSTLSQKFISKEDTTVVHYNNENTGLIAANNNNSFIAVDFIPQEGSYPKIYSLCQHSFFLSPGVVIQIVKSITDTHNTGERGLQELTTRLIPVTMDKTQVGGSFNFIRRQEYGWNGTSWELNHPDSKTTHLDTQELFQGVTARFEDSESGTSFVTPSHYQFVLFDGFTKDNATKARFTHLIESFMPPTKRTTDLEFNTVPNIRTGATGVVGIDLYNSSEQAQIDISTGYVRLPGQNTGQYATGSIPLVGDFVINYDTTHLSSTLRKWMNFGISRSVNMPAQGLFATGSPVFGFAERMEQLPDRQLTSYNLYGGSYVNTGTTTTTTSLQIKRQLGIITAWRNGTLVHTYSTSGYTTTDITETDFRGGIYKGVIRPVHKVLELIWSTDLPYYEETLPEEGFLGPSVEIISNGSAVYMYMGNPATFTGRFQQGFAGIDMRPGYEPTILIDGIPATILKNYLDPGPGEVYLDAYSGVLYFNESDAGKSISAEYGCIVR